MLESLHLEDDGAAFAVLLNPSGGILGGDLLETEISVGPGAHVGIATASATKVYRSPDRPAAQHMRIDVADDAILEYVPHHLICRPGSALDQTVSIDLDPSARLLFYDGVSLGRGARDEPWDFHRFASEVRIVEEGRPLYWDRLRLEGSRLSCLGGLGGTDGRTYVGTVLFCDSRRRAWGDVLDALAQLLEERDVVGGVSLLSRGGCVLKILAPSAHALTLLARRAWAVGRRHLLGRPPLDLRLD